MAGTEPIRRIARADGAVRYRLVVDVGRRADGRRDQRTSTHSTFKEARAELSRIRHEVNRATYVPPIAQTLEQYLDGWLPGAQRRVRPSTFRGYVDALKPVREQLGRHRLQQLSKSNIDTLVDNLLTSGRRIGGKGRPLNPRTVTLTLTILRMALEDALREGRVARNVAKLVDAPKRVHRDMKTWTADEAKAFLVVALGDRLAPAWLLSLYGMRRGEVLGLRWSDVDLEQRTVTISQTRASVGGTLVVTSEPKTARGRRQLPLDAGVCAALKSLLARQAAEKRFAGGAYRTKGLVIVNELGEPVRPEWYSDRFARLARTAGVPAIRLHNARHTAATLLHLRGVPLAVISAWLGHADPAFTLRTYAKSQADMLREASVVLGDAIGSGSGIEAVGVTGSG
ncbi:MAG: tyrosine-type recombinase/integrase [Mycobacteriales bacterium]